MDTNLLARYLTSLKEKCGLTYDKHRRLTASGHGKQKRRTIHGLRRLLLCLIQLDAVSADKIVKIHTSPFPRRQRIFSLFT